ncbi:MAG: PorV/PorQ family protein, partial [Elusimicrobia bacterium]|nr:PorV/PorQ family protein [Elusimicrobiota bacterium]
MSSPGPGPRNRSNRVPARAVLAAAGVLLFSTRALAGGAGTAAAEFLQLGFGARAVGFAEAFVPVADDVSALYYNPAGLAYPALYDPKSRSGPDELLAAQSLLVQDIGLTQVGFVRRPFGVSMTYLNLGGIEQRTLETDAPTNAGASDLAVGATCARRIAGVGFGVTGKYIRETIASYSASSYALDVGALRRFERLPVSVGFDLSNAGTPVRFISQSYPLPTTASVGVAYGATRAFPSAVVLQGDLPNGSNPDLRLGFEYRGFGPFALRAG